MIKIIWRFISYIKRPDVQLHGVAEGQIFFIVKALKLNAQK
jgi:hypothetical protein